MITVDSMTTLPSCTIVGTTAFGIQLHVVGIELVAAQRHQPAVEAHALFRQCEPCLDRADRCPAMVKREHVPLVCFVACVYSAATCAGRDLSLGLSSQASSQLSTLSDLTNLPTHRPRRRTGPAR